MPPGTYVIAGVINIPSDTTMVGAGMWYTTLVGNPVKYTNSSLRVGLNGTGGNIHLSDFAITGKLNYRNDSEPNDGLGGSYWAGSTISRVWVEHTKTGAWIINSQGLIVDSCRFRDTIADGINLAVGMQGTIVTNCSTRGTGDDCFPIWPTTYTQQMYSPGSNLITHCTGELPFLANGGAIYGGPGNVIENCLFQDIPYEAAACVDQHNFSSGHKSFQRNKPGAETGDLYVSVGGGYDPGWGWRAALELCMNPYSITGIELSDLNLVDNISDGMSVVVSGTTGQTDQGRLSNTSMDGVNIPNYGLGASGRNDFWVTSGALGSIAISDSTVVEYQNDSTGFTINYPAPALTFTTTASNAVVLSWPFPYAHFLLQKNSDVATTNWQSAGYQVSTSGGINSVTVPFPASNLLFRLWNYTGGKVFP